MKSLAHVYLSPPRNDQPQAQNLNLAVKRYMRCSGQGLTHPVQMPPRGPTLQLHWVLSAVQQQSCPLPLTSCSPDTADPGSAQLGTPLKPSSPPRWLQGPLQTNRAQAYCLTTLSNRLLFLLAYPPFTQPPNQKPGHPCVAHPSFRPAPSTHPTM